MIIYVDIDGTICFNKNSDYENSEPRYEQIDKINKLYNEGHEIVYWTARGATTGIDWRDVTMQQLLDWKCKFHRLQMGTKPHYDLLICDKTKRIEEI